MMKHLKTTLLMLSLAGTALGQMPTAKKLSELTPADSLSPTDIFEVTINPGSTPLTRKGTIAQILDTMDDTLQAFGSITTAADKLPYLIGTDDFGTTDFSAFARDLLGDSSAADMRGTLGLGAVENTALSTWAGSANLTTLGTVATGVWEGTVIDGTKVETQMSVAADGSGVKLSGDEASPGNNKMYGTDGGGAKGWHDVPAAGLVVDEQTFSADGTWTKPAGALWCEVFIVGGGGGGGSGCVSGTAAHKPGGAGGSPGAYVHVSLPANFFAGTEAVVVGQGGAGGAAQTTTASGAAGGNGTASSIAGITAVSGFGGDGGTSGGSSSSGGSGGANNSLLTIGAAASASNMLAFTWSGGASTGTANGASPNASPALTPTAGGGAGGLTSSDVVTNGGAGGGYTTSYYTNFSAIFGAAASGGTGDGDDADPGASRFNYVGMGGGGGAGGLTLDGGDGGDGGAYGGGGGGGGAAFAGLNSGKGGDGGDGIVVVRTFCAP